MAHVPAGRSPPRARLAHPAMPSVMACSPRPSSCPTKTRMCSKISSLPSSIVSTPSTRPKRRWSKTSPHPAGALAAPSQWKNRYSKTASPPAPEKSPIEQITGAFRDPRNKEDLALLHRYEARLHNLYQRTVRGIAGLRKLLTANLGLPNEPKNPLVCNTAPNAQAPQTPHPEAGDSPAPLEEVSEDSKNSGRSHAPQCALAADGGRCLNHREQQTNHYEDCETCGDDHRALPPITSPHAIKGPLPLPVRRLLP